MKTPVREIRLFDLDLLQFITHSGPLEGWTRGVREVESRCLPARYDNFRNGLVERRSSSMLRPRRILEGVTFAFVCVDKAHRGPAFSISALTGIPFIDVGMGLKRQGRL